MQTESFIPGKDASLESSIATMLAKLEKLDFHVEQRSWLNPVDGVWSVHVRDRDCPLRFTSTLIGLAAAADSFWADLRVGELKTILALAVGDDEAIREGCEWVRHFEQIDPARRLVCRCIETLLELGGADRHRAALEHLYGSTTLASAEAMLRGEQRCFGIEAPGLALKGCDLHQALLAAYAKLSH